MASPLLTLAQIKAALDVTHDDHDDMLTSIVDAAQWQAIQFIGVKWLPVIDALPVIREAMTAYARDVYNGNPEAFATNADRSHLFYRLLKPLASTDVPSTVDTTGPLTVTITINVAAPQS